MKRLSLVFVLGASAFLLVGCDNYKKLSEEEFNAYFSEEKVNAAKEHFAAINCFYYEVMQTTKEFDYDLWRYSDTDYYYQYAVATVEGKKDTSHDLYLGSSNVDDCKWYGVSSSGENKVTIGQQAFNTYDDQRGSERKTITRAMDDPSYFAKEFSVGVANKKYYRGGNNLKITFKSSGEDQEEMSGYGIFDSKTLLVSSFVIKIKTAEASGTIKYKFTYDKSFKHKTPQDIGYKE